MVVKHTKPKSKSLSFKVAKLENIVKADRPEHKFYDVPLGTTIAYTANTMYSSITSLCTIAQGVNINERVGNEIKLLSINFKAYPNVNGDMDIQAMRCFLVEDKQQISDTAPAVSDIFSNIDPNNYLLSIANLKRFRILAKSKVRYQNNATTGHYDTSEYQQFNMFQSFKFPLKVRYNGIASTDGQKKYSISCYHDITKYDKCEFGFRASM